MDKKYLILSAIAAGLVLGVAVKKGAEKAKDAFDPTNPNNVANKAFEGLFEWSTGMPIEDVLIPGSFDATSGSNLANRGFESVFKAATGKPIEDVLKPGTFDFIDPTSNRNLANRAFEMSWLYKASRDGSLDPTDSNNYANRAFETVKGWF